MFISDYQRLWYFVVMSAAKWSTFIKRCLLKRTSGDEFQELADYMNDRYRVPGTVIIKAILSCRTTFALPGDPLIAAYLQSAINLGLATVADGLQILILGWNRLISGGNHGTGLVDTDSKSSVTILSDLARVASQTENEEKCRFIPCSIYISKWLRSVALHRATQSPTRVEDHMYLEAIINYIVVTTNSNKRVTQIKGDLKGRWLKLLQSSCD